jgi:hypothetical protein
MRIGFAIALTTGIVFSLVRVVQGAHFLSHALWAASIDWLCAALVLTPSLGRQAMELKALSAKQYQQTRHDQSGACERTRRNRFMQEGPCQQDRDDNASLVDQGDSRHVSH